MPWILAHGFPKLSPDFGNTARGPTGRIVLLFQRYDIVSEITEFEFCRFVQVS